MRRAPRRLSDLTSVGKATLADLDELGVRTVDALAAAQPEELYLQLCELAGTRVDLCALDVLRAAHAQAVDPDLPAEDRKWWTWSRRRKLSARSPW